MQAMIRKEGNRSMPNDSNLEEDDELDDNELDDEDELDDDEDWSEPDPSVKPPESKIQIERFPDGVTIQVPPAGIAGTKGMFVFALIWDGAMAVFTAFILFAAFNGKNNNPDSATWILPVFLGVFWLAGIGLLLGSLNMARRKAAIAVTSGTLMVIQTGLFGTKQRTWEPGGVRSVRLGSSGMEVNDVPIQELQIEGGPHSKFGMLAGRSNDELAWLAYEIRQALGLPH